MVRNLFIFFFSLGFLALSSSLGAQTIPGIGQAITLSLIPTNPEPNQLVVIKAQSYSTDLNSATFRWSVNGKLQKEGVGLKEFQTKTGKNGTAITVSVEIATQNSGTLRESISFRPAEVSLVWESDGYTPPFYKGRGLYTFSGTIKVTAIPEFFGSNGKRINPKDLVYTWKKNGEVVADASGYGKDSFTSSKTSYLRDGNDIGVEVSSPRETVTGSASINVTPAELKVLLYEKSPLYGILFDKAITNRFNLVNEEVTLYAVPFFFSSQNNSIDGLSFDWVMNKAHISEVGDKNEITLRKEPGQTGNSDVSITIQNPRKPLQGGSVGTRIQFQ
jgi:hypothetical protein